MSVGKKVKQLREERGLTQEELAKKLGYSHKSSINKIESGKADLTQSKIIEIARVFGVSPCYLLEVEGEWDRHDENASPTLSTEVKLFEGIKVLFGSDAVELFTAFVQLNEQGKKKALETVSDLLEIPKYQKGE